ncbi:MAG: GC-type dockerin domain-anchored protein [Phycisphaerales bacterium]
MRTQSDLLPLRPSHLAVAFVLAAAGHTFGQAEVNVAAKGRVTASSSAAANPPSLLIDGLPGTRWISNGTAAANGDCGGTGGETITWWTDTDIPIERVEIAGARPADNGFSNYQVLFYDQANQLVLTRPNGTTPCGSTVAIGAGDTNIAFSTLVPPSGGGTDVPVLASRVVVNFTGRSGAGGVGELRIFTKRPGAMPPLGPKPDKPVLRDDEVVMFLGSAAEGTARMGVMQPLTNSPAPTVQVRGVAQPAENAYELWPVVAAQAGRVYGAAAEQTVVLRNNGGTQYVVQVLDTYAGNTTPPVKPIIRGEYLFNASSATSDVALLVADIDKKPINGLQQEEIVLGFETTEAAPPNRRVLGMTVLRFDSPGDLSLIPPTPAAPTVVFNGQPRYTFPSGGPTLGILRANGSAPNRIIVKPFRIGNSVNDPDLLLVCHMASDRTSPVYAIIPAEQIGGTVAPRNSTSTSTVASSLVHSSQVNTMSWDVWTGRLSYTPASQAGDDALFVTRWQATGADIAYTPLRWTNTSEAGGVPDLQYESGGSFTQTTRSINSTRTGSSVLAGLSLINNARIETRKFNVVGIDSFGEHDGMAVLGHTTRGPFVQVLGLITIPPDGENRLEQISSSCWPTAAEAAGRATYTTPTQTSIAAGLCPLKRSDQNVVANRRNAVWLYSTVAHGAMSPNRIVRINYPTSDSSNLAAPTTDTFTLNIADGGSGSPAMVGPIVMADIDGDSAMFSRQGTWFYAAPTRLSFDNFAAPLAIIQEPPKHIDYFRPYHATGSPQNGQRGVFSITGDPAFVSEFENSQGADVSSTVAQTVSSTVGTTSSWSVGGGFSAETPVASAEVSANYTNTTGTELTNIRTSLNLATTSFSFSNRVSTAFDDGLILQERDMDVWRYPLAGPTGSATADNAAGITFAEFAIPGPLPPATLRAGKDLARYQPLHINGNMLSYPLVGRLATIATADRRPFGVGSASTNFNSLVNSVTDFTNPPSFTPSGISTNATITFTNLTGTQTDYQTSTTMSSSNTYDITAEAKLGGNLFGVVDVGATVTGGYSQTFSNNNTFSTAVTSLNTSSVTNQWQIIMPPFTDLGPLQQNYTIRSFVFFDKAGAAKLQYAVDLPTGGSNFWAQNYSAPDASLNLPYRIISFQNQWQLSAFPDRFKMRSFEVRDLETRSQRLNLNLGDKVVDKSPAARDLAIYARVYNLSYASSLNNLASRFDMVEINDQGQPVGSPVFLGNGELLEDTAAEPDAAIQPPPAYRAAISTIPARGTALVRLALLSTDNLGPSTPTGSARTYRILVTLDPNNAISNETHELFDRDADPLAAGDTIFASAFGGSQLLEKGQNNFGWFDIQIGKSLCKLPDITSSPADRQVSPGQNTTFTAQITQRIGEVLTYQWKRNGANVTNGGRFSGATSPILTITGVQTADAGDYTLAVTNSCATVLSTPAHLTTGCGPADVAGLGGSTGADGALTADDVIAYLTGFFGNNLAIADIAGLGGTPGPNGTLTVDDIIFFLGNFFQPCP